MKLYKGSHSIRVWCNSLFLILSCTRSRQVLTVPVKGRFKWWLADSNWVTEVVQRGPNVSHCHERCLRRWKLIESNPVMGYLFERFRHVASNKFDFKNTLHLKLLLKNISVVIAFHFAPTCSVCIKRQKKTLNYERNWYFNHAQSVTSFNEINQIFKNKTNKLAFNTPSFFIFRREVFQLLKQEARVYWPVLHTRFQLNLIWHDQLFRTPRTQT